MKDSIAHSFVNVGNLLKVTLIGCICISLLAFAYPIEAIWICSVLCLLVAALDITFVVLTRKQGNKTTSGEGKGICQLEGLFLSVLTFTWFYNLFDCLWRESDIWPISLTLPILFSGILSHFVGIVGGIKVFQYLPLFSWMLGINCMRDTDLEIRQLLWMNVLAYTTSFILPCLWLMLNNYIKKQ